MVNKELEVCTLDGSIDSHGHPAVRERTGTWFAGILILGNLIHHHLKKLYFNIQREISANTNFIKVYIN